MVKENMNQPADKTDGNVNSSSYRKLKNESLNTENDSNEKETPTDELSDDDTQLLIEEGFKDENQYNVNRFTFDQFFAKLTNKHADLEKSNIISSILIVTAIISNNTTLRTGALKHHSQNECTIHGGVVSDKLSGHKLTPLMVACYIGNTDIINHFMKKDHSDNNVLQIDNKNSLGNNALHYACLGRNMKSLCMLC